MTLRFNVTENDYLQFNIFHNKHSPTVRRTLLLLRFLLPVMLISFTFLSGRLSTINLISIAIISVIWFCVTPALFLCSIKRSVRRLMKEGKCNEFVGERTVIFSEASIRLEAETRTVETSFSAVERIVSDDERFYIYIGAISAYIIPFSAFATKAEKAEFEAFINARQGQ